MEDAVYNFSKRNIFVKFWNPRRCRTLLNSYVCGTGVCSDVRTAPLQGVISLGIPGYGYQENMYIWFSLGNAVRLWYSKKKNSIPRVKLNFRQFFANKNFFVHFRNFRHFSPVSPFFAIICFFSTFFRQFSQPGHFRQFSLFSPWQTRQKPC